MGNSEIELVGSPCGQHGPYTFYKAFRYSKNGSNRIMSLSEFFFVKLWSDSDLMCIGELQLLWIDKNSEQVLCSLRLYFLPENTPEGRMDHGEDEVLAISEKVVLRVEDLLTWITMDAEWSWGRIGHYDGDVKIPPKIIDIKREDEEEDEQKPCSSSSSSSNSSTSTKTTESVLSNFKDLDIKPLDKENKFLNGPAVIVLSYPRYCRYRALMKRLQGVEDQWLKSSLIAALGGFTAPTRNTRILFCRDTFDYPDLEGHELLCNHLAPKLKGRPRGKRKKRSISPQGSESNESESNECNVFTTAKVKESKVKLTTSAGRNGLRCNNAKTTSPRRSTRSNSDNANEWEFLGKLNSFMKTNKSPIGRVPTVGSKEMDLYKLFTKVQKLGGYDHVTSKRMWKTVFEDLGGHAESTSAATVIRKHYERLLLPYERHMNSSAPIEYKPTTKTKRLKSRVDSSDVESNSSVQSNVSGPAVTIEKVKPEAAKTSSLRSVRVKPERIREKEMKQEETSTETRPDQVVYNVRVTSTVSSMANAENRIPPLVEGKENVPIKKSPSGNEDKDSENSSDDVEGSKNVVNNVKKRKLDILKEGGLEVTPIPIDSVVILKDQTTSKPASIINHVSITVTSDGKTPGSRNPTASSSTSPNPKNGIQSQPFFNLSPPKVVQSRSIYTYSEKTVYGNPKDLIMPPPPPVYHAPRNYVKIPTRPTCPVEILDLSSGKMPQHHNQIVEIVKIPSVPSSKDSAQLNSKFPASLLDNKRLGPNLEITLVGSPSPKGLPINHHDGEYPFKRSSTGRIVKKANAATNGKPYPPANIPPNYRFEGSSKQKQSSSPKANAGKPFAYGSSQTFPEYLSQLHTVLKSGQQPIGPIHLDPSLYYTAALYSPNLLSMTPGQGNAGTSPDQVYKDMIRMRYPPWMGQDGTNAMTVNYTNGSIRKDK